MMSDVNNKPMTKEQVRVLACLMEKHLATPKNYPLTPNSLTLACNQKSNRSPVMSLEEGKVVGTMQQLKELGFASIDYGERIVKFSHRAPGMLKVTREEQAVLAMLMLREPLTLSDIKARTEKMVGFESIERVKESVSQLMSRTPALVMELPVAVGQREERYTHLLAGEPDLSEIAVKPTKATSRSQSSKVAELEARIERLEQALDMVWQESDSDDA
ncbi:YceH family protein [Arenicella sp. 4NH20-0111]|uniref:DUF480 domain-containing protein n=1 Tax=Arenicella sp. 4NH20-0111 TaxID=3127648 RepID=UPI003106E2AF